jgi:hypothetical protein
VTPGLFLSLVGGAAIRTTTQGHGLASPRHLSFTIFVDSVCLIVVHAQCSISRIFMVQTCSFSCLNPGLPASCRSNGYAPSAFFGSAKA